MNTTIVVPILQKIIRVLLMTLGSAASGWLVTRHLLTPADQTSLVGLLGDAAPAVLGAVPGVAWDLYVWLNKFSFVTKIEAALHLPITGKPSAAVLDAVGATVTGEKGQ